MDILKELEKFLLTEIAIDIDKKSLSPDEDLISSGIIDSMGILKVTAYLEKRFGIKVKDDEISPDNFRDINSLKRFIESKRGK